MANIIITGCDAGYFEYAQALIQSLREAPGLGAHQLAFLDFGLTDAQRQWLAGERVLVKSAGWDMDFPGRATWEATKPWFKVYLCRPHLRRHFPGYDVYVWLDADTWVQRGEAVEDLMAAAQAGGMAAVPEVDRSYFKFTTGFNAWDAECDTAVRCLGEELGERLRHTPVFNGGVFAMHRNAPHWDRWRHYLQAGLNRVDPSDENARMAEQVALNAAIHLHRLPTQRFPCTYNWLACLALPSWDVATESFVEPSPPHAPVGIMHLSLHVLEKAVPVVALHERRAALTLKTGVTWAGRLALVAGRASIQSALGSSAATHASAAPRVSAPASDRDYVSPGLEAVSLDACFPHMVVGDKRGCAWPFLRRDVPHRWYVDDRAPHVGFLNRDEAHILYNTGRQFAGRRALEIGCWMGWSACHLARAGVQLDVIDPILSRPAHRAAVVQSLEAAQLDGAVNLVGGTSPAAVRELAMRERRRWSLIFIDGDHEGAAPLRDTVECVQHAEADAAILFHDLAAPDVAAGLAYLQDRGWNVQIYQTMQVMGVAWRGSVVPVAHTPDPGVAWDLPAHLQRFPVAPTIVADPVRTVSEPLEG